MFETYEINKLHLITTWVFFFFFFFLESKALH